MQVLVVSNCEADRLALSDLLHGLGHSPAFAADAVAALRSMGKKCPDLVLCDAEVPGLSAPLLLRTAGIVFPDTPIVLLTAGQAGQTSDWPLRSSVADYLTKPVRADRLQALLGRLDAPAEARGR